MSEWIKLIIISGIPTALLVYLVMNPDKFEHWVAILYRGLRVLSSNLPRIKRKFDRYAVAYSIQDSVNGVCAMVNRESPNVLPHALKIDWVRSVNPASFITKGQVVVRLRHYDNQDRNIVDSTLLYLKVGLLPRSKNCLDKTLRKSCEFKVASKVFIARRDTGAYDYFLENELNPATKNEPKLQQDLQMLADMDSVGFLTHVFLSEVKQTGDKLLGTIPPAAVQQELRNFAAFLQTIASKGWREDVPLQFKGVRVKVAVVLVAKKETIHSYGIKPYLNAISRSVREGYESIYISGWGEEFVKRVINIKDEVQEKLVKVLRRYDHPVRNEVKGILLVCQSNLSYLARQKELQEEVKSVMAEVVPEIKDGDIEIVSIARIKDVGCKIAVRPVSEEDISATRKACIGENRERIDAVESRFPGEFVGIVSWSDDVREFIVNALAPLKARFVETVEIDEENLIANITLSTEEACKVALGAGHNNVKVASELTGWVINIQGPKYTGTIPTPDKELQETLIEYIPELKSGEIEIVKIARIKGIGSRVVVK